MRLVDADALVERIVKLTCVPCREKGNDYKGVKCRACQYGDEIDDIESAPTIEERKMGRWDRTEDEYGDFLCWSCSECGERYVLPHHRASYCPNCGAKMEGEDDGSDR